MSKKVGIIGSGVVAQTLGAGFLKHGYEVQLGTRDASRLAEWQGKEGKGARVGTVAETASFGDVVVLAVKGTAVKDVISGLGPDSLKGKTVIDATNPIADEPPVNGVLKFFTDINWSSMEELQKTAQQAHFVKAFSSIGSPFMVNPQFESTPSMFICGNNKEAKAEVIEIVELFGFEPEDMGSAEAARAIEPLCMLWCIPGFSENRWSHAFKLLKL